MNLVSASFDVEIAEIPVGKKTLIERAIKDITNYVDVKTADDVTLFFGLVDYIDGKENPIDRAARQNIINGSSLVRDGKFIMQELALLKTNKSWHTSEIANNCSYFGDQCVNRGQLNDEHRRGRKATRHPNEYHRTKATGVIDREQLTTTALEALWHSIPKELMVSAIRPKSLPTEDDLRQMDRSQLERLMAEIERVRSNG